MSYYNENRGMGFSLFPPMLKLLLMLNGAIFLLDSVIFEVLAFNGVSLSNYIMEYFALHPIQSGMFWPWQLISYQFLHAGFSHIFFNLLALWMFGAELEMIWGSRRFITYYLIAGMGGGLIHLGMQLLPGFEGAPTIGASGAVMGILLGFGLTFPDRPVMMFPLFIPIPAKYFVLIYAGIDLFSGLFSTSSGVAHFAHLGGAFFGYIMLKHGDDLKIYALVDKIFGPSKQQSSYGNIIDYPFEKTYVEVVEEVKPPEPKGTMTGVFMDGREITTEEIDTILEKITAQGFANLTEQEKRILYEVSKKLD